MLLFLVTDVSCRQMLGRIEMIVNVIDGGGCRSVVVKWMNCAMNSVVSVALFAV